jgi:hypothetical protein
VADKEPRAGYCFFIAPIGQPNSDTRIRSDQVFRHVVAPVAKACGLEAVRADKLSESGFITTQIVQHLIDDSMVIADLTDHNPNVFYELAIRHAFRKPFVQIIQDGQSIPFDVAGLRTIPVNHRDLDSVATAKDELQRQIERLQHAPESVESPVTVAVDRATLLRSEKREDRQLGQVIDLVTKTNHVVSTLERRLSAIESNGIFATIPSGVGRLRTVGGGTLSDLARAGSVISTHLSANPGSIVISGPPASDDDESTDK